jgi:hypothetical protein
MRTHAHRPRTPGAKSWLALVLWLSAAAAAAAPPAAESIDGGARAAKSARPRIGRIFFSPAERHGRQRGGLAATPAESVAAARERRVVNGALSSSSEGRAVWVNGTTVENSASAWTDRNGNVWLTNAAQGTHLVKPGQSIDRNGVIEDLLPPGTVARR